MKLVLLAIAVMLLASTSFARTLFVAQRTSGASDDNSGTEASALLTIGAALAKVGPGDEIIVKQGNYYEELKLRASGTEESPITLRAAEGHRVVVTGGQRVTGWQHLHDGIFYHDDWPYKSMALFIDHLPLMRIGPPLTEWYKGKLSPRGETLDDLQPGCFFVDEETDRLYIWPKDSDGPEYHPEYKVIEATVLPELLSPAREEGVGPVGWWTVKGITFELANTLIVAAWPALHVGGDGFVFEDCVVRKCDFAGIGIVGNRSVIRNCLIEWCGNNGIGAMGEGHIIEGTTMQFCNYDQWNQGWHCGGIKATVCKDVSFRNNIARYNWGPGVWFDIDCDNVIIEGNQVYANQGIGIHYEISKRGIIKGNLVADCVRGVWISGSDDCLVEDNLFYHCRQGLVFHGMPREGYTLRGNRGFRNIILDSQDEEIVVYKDTEASSDNLADSNTYYRHDGKFSGGREWNGDCFTLSDWQETGQDTHSRYEDPGYPRAMLGEFPGWPKRAED